MGTYVYVWIEGIRFSPEHFQDSLDQSLRGAIEYRKQLQNGNVARVRKHWKSHKINIENSEDAIEKLCDLIKQLRPALLNIKEDAPVIVAEVVSRFSHGRVGGYYMSCDAIKLFAEVGVSLDIDQYYDEDESV